MTTSLSSHLLEQTDMVSIQVAGMLADLSDAEFLWEPVPDCWTLRRRLDIAPEQRNGPLRSAGEWAIDEVKPDPVPAPFTTIAWRVTHLTLAVWMYLNVLPPVAEPDQVLAVPPGDAASSVRWANGMLAQFRELVASYEDAALAEQVPVWEGMASRAFVVGHVHREVVHHAAEVGALRDLYRFTVGPNGSWTHV